jgi:hypothetical protein
MAWASSWTARAVQAAMKRYVSEAGAWREPRDGKCWGQKRDHSHGDATEYPDDLSFQPKR